MEEFVVLLAIALLGGWVLGVVGFFKVLSARSEIAALRRRVDVLAAGQAAPADRRTTPGLGSVRRTIAGRGAGGS